MKSTSVRLLDTAILVENYGNEFLLLRSENHLSLTEIGTAIYRRKFSFVEEVIATEKEICLKLSSSFSEQNSLQELSRIEQEDKHKSQRFILPVLFDESADKESIEEATGKSFKEVIHSLCEMQFPLAMYGFLPGFLYLNIADKAFHIPRKTVPNKYIEAGSLALGGPYLGLYALDSPGGWHLIGKTPLNIFEQSETPPIPLTPGDTIQLKAINKPEFTALKTKKITLRTYNSNLSSKG